MIQRRQTLWLLLGIVACIVCLCLPVGSLLTEGMNPPGTLYNGCATAVEPLGNPIATGWLLPLFFLLIVAAAVAVIAIFRYKHRPQQMKLCTVSIVCIVLWYALLAVVVFTQLGDTFRFRPSFTAILPLLAACLFFLARRGILHDERLVRSADRIRD